MIAYVTINQNIIRSRPRWPPGQSNQSETFESFYMLMNANDILLDFKRENGLIVLKSLLFSA
jgi:hypothetical protein